VRSGPASTNVVLRPVCDLEVTFVASRRLALASYPTEPPPPAGRPATAALDH
jgi:hypothetical protein